jgi:hypothetical protein
VSGRILGDLALELCLLTAMDWFPIMGHGDLNTNSSEGFCGLGSRSSSLIHFPFNLSFFQLSGLYQHTVCYFLHQHCCFLVRTAVLCFTSHCLVPSCHNFIVGTLAGNIVHPDLWNPSFASWRFLWCLWFGGNFSH